MFHSNRFSIIALAALVSAQAAKAAPPPATPAITDAQHIALYNQCIAQGKFDVWGFINLVADVATADEYGFVVDLLGPAAENAVTGHGQPTCLDLLTPQQLRTFYANKHKTDGDLQRGGIHPQNGPT